MNKKTILIFGAGINQLELIKASKELGIISVVIDPMSDPPGKKEADFFYQIEGRDYNGTRQVAQNHKVDGIVTAQMENPLRMMAQLAEEMGFIFNSPQTIEKCRDKYLMKQAFQSNAVPCANGIMFSKNDSVDSTILKKSGLNFPLIIKPTDAHSSRGVFKVENIKDLHEHLEESANFSTTNKFLVEEFLEGKEYSLEAITYKGKTQIIQFTEKIITPYPRTVEIGHLQPAVLSVEERKELETVTKKAISALGIDNSASHTELKITKDGVKVIEIGARLGGDFIGSHLTKASTGVSMDKAAIQVALGIEPDLTPKTKACSFIKYIELPIGKKVKEVLPLTAILKMENVVFAQILIKQGDVIQTIEHSAQRPACIIVTANSMDEVKTIAGEIETQVKEKLIQLS